jgi:hypothetical protein
VDALGTSDRVVMAMHGVGMVCTVIVLVQLAGGARGLPVFVTVVTGLAIVGRVLFVNRCSSLGPGLQQLWHEAMSIGGVSLVPQVILCPLCSECRSLVVAELFTSLAGPFTGIMYVCLFFFPNLPIYGVL